VINDKLQREVFHFLFLEKLLKISEPKFYILKGGVNFRFFFQSPRYSEDMDLDVLGGSVETIKKNGYKILEDAAFVRSLKAYGISNLILSDPSKAKQTSTTQRFRLRLVNEAGEEFPTKVEFSRRDSTSSDDMLLGNINPQIAAKFGRLTFSCFHYTAESAVLQKVRALAGRTETQARDVFDLYLLYLGGSVHSEKIIQKISSEERQQAVSALDNLSYEHYRGQVVEYLETEVRLQYDSQETWNLMCTMIRECLHE